MSSRQETSKWPLLFSHDDLPEIVHQEIKFQGIRAPLWTQQKAELIAQYIRLFTLITKHGTYIDGFAGPQNENIDDSWAASLVLNLEPKWIKGFFLCDLNQKKAAILQELADSEITANPQRKIKVVHGDFNKAVNEIPKTGLVGPRTASFCLLDQRTFECDWQTVVKIAKLKSKNKVEIFYFVPTGWLGRSLSALGDRRKLVTWWGRPDWQQLYGASKQTVASLFEKRFLNELKYRYVYSWPIMERFRGLGRVMYHMIHATDHYEAPKLMHRAYKKATRGAVVNRQTELEF